MKPSIPKRKSLVAKSSVLLLTKVIKTSLLTVSGLGSLLLAMHAFMLEASHEGASNHEPESSKAQLQFSGSLPQLFSHIPSTLLTFWSPAVREDRSSFVPQIYSPIEELESQFGVLAVRYPHLVKTEQIGTSTAKKHPIWAYRLTTEPDKEHDKPAILFTALHHAREPAGIFICQAIMQTLLTNYGSSKSHTRLLDSLEVWIVPFVNPDGYDYILTSRKRFPWWRKNLRDNNADGKFDPAIDGVDLNRNYDYNWHDGGDSNPSSWFYRGENAFSENEITALRDLAIRKNFVIGVSYHSYGEAILYPWGNYHRVPDQRLILDIARNCAAKIGKLSGQGTYGYLPLNAREGQSSIWMYAELGIIDFIIETGETYFPRAHELPAIVWENVRGAMYLMERTLRSSVYGHVIDDETGEPLVADIHVIGYERSYVKPRHSNGTFGRFDRLLLPGTYKIKIERSGYRTAVLENVKVKKEKSTRIEVRLARAKSRNLPVDH